MAQEQAQSMILLRFQFRKAFRASVGILFALLLAYAPTLTLNAQQSATAIVFDGHPNVSEQQWPALFRSLRADLADGSGELPNGSVLDRNPAFLRDNVDLSPRIDFANVIEVELLGHCDVLPQTYRPSLGGPLGWVRRVSGVIQPFVFIDCTRIAQVLRWTTAGLGTEERQDEMTQAIAHVLIHEWIHVATQDASHGAQGITKGSLSVDELIGERRNNRLPVATH